MRKEDWIKKSDPNKIEGFFGEYRFLSNYWPVQVECEGTMYPSVEQAYKATKTLDRDVRLKIAQLIPNKKDLGEDIEKILSETALREDWSDDFRIEVMKELVRMKFDGRDPVLYQKLIDTGGLELIEDNWWGDVFFGVCDGVGENHLGKILMKVRSEIK